jgi:hypothetical protein
LAALNKNDQDYKIEKVVDKKLD